MPRAYLPEHFPEIPGEAYRNHPFSDVRQKYLGRQHATGTAAAATVPTRSESVDSTTSSAADRLQWRSHPALVSPGLSLEDRNPFDSVETTTGPDGHLGGGGDDVNVVDYAEEERAETEKEFWNGDGSLEEEDKVKKGKLSWRERIRHFTWTWFCMTMATGGIANVLNTGNVSRPCLFFPLANGFPFYQKCRFASKACMRWDAYSSS